MVGTVNTSVVYCLTNVDVLTIKTSTIKILLFVGKLLLGNLGSYASEWLLMSEQRQGKIIQYFILLSAGSVSGLKGQLIFCTSQGFFEFVFCVVLAFFSDGSEL